MFWKKWFKSNNKKKSIAIVDKGFLVNDIDKTLVKWNTISRIVGYKNDKITYDEVCLNIDFGENKSITISEEYQGWRELISEIGSSLELIDSNWLQLVMKPAFERKEIELFNLGNLEVGYRCANCGEFHKEWPALGFLSPSNYNDLTENERDTIANLDTDFCQIEYEDQIDRFIRVTLTQKVINSCQNLEYGLWVSLSEKSYNDYQVNFNNANHKESYFGWLCSLIPEYDSTMSIPCDVITKLGNVRPEIIPHQNHEHQFVIDYFNGISMDEAITRINKMVKNVG